MTWCKNPNCNCKQPNAVEKDYSAIWRRKRADREWELAGLARQDGDIKAEYLHTNRARAIDCGEI